MKSKKISSLLPSSSTGFVGRREVFEKIDKAINSQHIIICASPGTGKTSCAYKYAEVQKTKNVTVRWFDADSPEKLIESYIDLAIELNIDITSLFKNSTKELIKQQEVLINMVNEQLKKNGHIIFIFDDPKKFQDIELYINNLPTNVKTIITTNNKNLTNTLLQSEKILLNHFDNYEAKKYLQNNLNVGATQELDNLIKTVGTMPYKLSKAVAYLNTNTSTISNYLQELRTTAQSSSQAETDMLLETLNKHLKEEKAWQILQYIPYFDPDFIYVEIIKKLLSIDDQKLEPILKLLSSLSFISIEYKNENKGLKVHKLLQEEVKYYIKTIYSQKSSILSEQDILNNIVKALNSLFPAVDEAPDKRWDIAKLLYVQVIKIFNNEFDNLDIKSYVADLSSKVGYYFHYAMCEFDIALKFYKKTFDIRKEINKSVKSEMTESFLANALMDLGKFYNHLSNDQESLKCFLEALIIRIKLSEGNSADLASTYYYLGITYENLHHVTTTHNKCLESALRNAQISLSIRMNLNEPKDIAKSLDSVAGIYETFNKHEKALELYEEALNLRKELYKNEPNSNHPDIAESLSNIGMHYHEIGRKNFNDKSFHLKIKNEKIGIKYLQEALSMLQDIYGTDNHYTIAGVYYNLGLANNVIGETKAAEKNFNNSLNICRELYPAGSYQTIKSLNSLALISKNFSKDTLQAYKYYEEAWQICKILKLEKNNYIQKTLDDNMQILLSEDKGVISSYLSTRKEEELQLTMNMSFSEIAQEEQVLNVPPVFTGKTNPNAPDFVLDKKFNMSASKSEIESFHTIIQNENLKNKYIEDFIVKNLENNVTLRTDVYSLLLNAAIRFKKLEVLEYILNIDHKDNILIFQDNTGYSPISSTLYSGNRKILDLIKNFIDTHKATFKKGDLTGKDFENILTVLEFSQFEDMDVEKCIQEYLKPLFNKESIDKVTETLMEGERETFEYPEFDASDMLNFSDSELNDYDSSIYVAGDSA